MSAPNARRSQSSSKRPSTYRSQAYYLPSELHSRLKAAWWATKAEPDGAPSLSALVSRIIAAEVDHLEIDHNRGKQFPSPPRTARAAKSSSSPGHRNHTYYLSSELHGRLKAAWWATNPEVTLSSLVAMAMSVEADRLEARYNASKPFPLAPVGARGVDPAASRRQGQFMTELWAEKRGKEES